MDSDSNAKLPQVQNISIKVEGLTEFQQCLLDKFEDYFVSGSVTSLVGEKLKEIASNYYFRYDDVEDEKTKETGKEETEKETKKETQKEEEEQAKKTTPSKKKQQEHHHQHQHQHNHDHKGAQENYSRFIEYAEFIDNNCSQFSNLDITSFPPLIVVVDDVVDDSSSPDEKKNNNNNNQETKTKKEASAAAATSSSTELQKNTKTISNPSSEDILQQLAKICDHLMDNNNEDNISAAASSFISIPYISAAMDFEVFEDLIIDTKYMQEVELEVEEK